mmetsp:Transcript_22586/g.55937  ORF Transcript_22586/g.55937 Transcript_22586/m.55937 type:complete len:200 (-) Transcript_22586:109-708(-)
MGAFRRNLLQAGVQGRRRRRTVRVLPARHEGADGGGGRVQQDVLHDRLAAGVGGDARCVGAQGGAPHGALSGLHRHIHAGGGAGGARGPPGRGGGDGRRIPAPTGLRGGRAQRHAGGHLRHARRCLLRISRHQQLRSHEPGGGGPAAEPRRRCGAARDGLWRQRRGQDSPELRGRYAGAARGHGAHRTHARHAGRGKDN